MKSHQLQSTDRKSRMRSGRGIAAGRGKTAGRGTKGQNARSGGQRRPGFEGGQNPLYARLPKLRGFRTTKKPTLQVTTGQIAAVKSSTVDHSALYEAGLIIDQYSKVKVVQKGDLTGKVTVKLDAASKGAVAAIEKAGGTFTQTAAPQRQKSQKTK